MLLAIDMGNTNIVFGFFRGERIIEKRIVPTKAAYSRKKLSAEIYNLLHRAQVEDIIISSVVPEALKAVKKALRGAFRKEPLVLGENITAPIRNLYRKPQQVGQDRLVNAVAAAFLYNKDKKAPIVVIDFGTAVTFDVISHRNEYMGGLIFPGIRLSLENLVKRAALLPKKIEIKSPNSLIGRDTKDSMRSGILNGYGSLCDGVIKRINTLLKSKAKVIATGGDARLLARYTGSIKNIDSDLTLKGLHIIYQSYAI